MNCPKCGSANEDGAKFCQSCGAVVSVAATAVPCSSCGASMAADAKFCPSCGKERTGTVEKSKTAAVMLAFFFSFFSYLYTYRRNYPKFLIIFGIWAFMVLLLAAFDVGDESVNIVTGLFGVALWIFVIIDNAVRSSKFYSYYPAPRTEGKSKALAVTLSFFFGPFGLLYTVRKDWGKMTTMIFGTLALHALFGLSGTESWPLNILPWLAAIILSAVRPVSYYEDYGKYY